MELGVGFLATSVFPKVLVFLFASFPLSLTLKTPIDRGSFSLEKHKLQRGASSLKLALVLLATVATGGAES